MTELKAMTIGALFDRTIKGVFSKHGLLLIGIFSTIIIVVGGLVVFTSGLISGSFSENLLARIGKIFDFLSMQNKTDTVKTFISILIFLVPTLLVYMLFSLSTIDVFGKRFLQQKISVFRIILGTFKLLPRFMLFLILIIPIAVIYFLIFFGLEPVYESLFNDQELYPFLTLFLFIVSIVYLSIFKTFFGPAIPVMVIENKGALKSVIRSVKLVVPNLFRVFGVTLLFRFLLIIGIYIIMIIMAVPFLAIFGFITAQIGSDSSSEGIFTILPIIIFACYIPALLIHECLASSFDVTVFFNQKIKTEGYGTEQLVESFIHSIPPGGEQQET